MHKTFKKMADWVGLETVGKAAIYSPVVGVVAGLGAAGFFWMLEGFSHVCLERLAGYAPPTAAGEGAAGAAQAIGIWTGTGSIVPWLIVLVPTLGGLICGLLVYSLAPEAEGHGTDAMVRSFHRLKGLIRGRIPFVKTIASVITIGTGGSAGREGPIAQIGAGFGSFLATRLGLTDRDRSLLILAGAAGGVGAIFRAPLGGALFAAEVLYNGAGFEFEAIVPCIISAVVAYATFATFFGQGAVFDVPAKLHYHTALDLPLYAGLGVVCAVVGIVYVAVFYGSRDYGFKKLRVPNHVKPAIGGLLLGVMALWLPQVLAGGYGYIQQAISGTIHGDPASAIGLMLLLAFGKIVATSLTISSGGSGGVFAPSLFIGAMVGGAYGTFCQGVLGESVTPGAFVLVGMAGFFSGVARVPITSVIMVCEMSNHYGLLVPLMLTCVISFGLNKRWMLYEEQVHAMIDSPAHLGDFVIDVLENIRVKEVMAVDRPVDLVSRDMPFPEILELVARSQNSYFPVVDEQGKMIGIFSLTDVRTALVDVDAAPLIVAMDLMTDEVLSITPEDDLHAAMRLFTQKNIDDLPVVASDDPKRVLGLLSRKAVIGAYDQEIVKLRGGA